MVIHVHFIYMYRLYTNFMLLLTSFLCGGNNYSEVCVQIRGYQYSSPDGFPSYLLLIDNNVIHQLFLESNDSLMCEIISFFS